MMSMVIGIVLLTVTVAPARAEHRALERTDPPEPPTVVEEWSGPDGLRWRDLDLQLKLERDGFRLGGRVPRPGGVAGAWLNGRVGGRGLSLDGRVQRPDGRAWNFRFDAPLPDWRVWVTPPSGAQD